MKFIFGIVYVIMAWLSYSFMLSNPVEACTISLPLSILLFIGLKQYHKYWLDKYVPIDRISLEKGMEFYKIKIVTKLTSFVEEYRKNKDGDFVLISCKEEI